jgi:hypothetical protein
MERIPPAAPSALPNEPASSTASSPSRSPELEFSQVLEALGSQMDRGQRLMRGVLHTPAALAPQQLLALQAGIYRYAEVVDLSTKLVDRASNAVKTTLQSQ